MRRIALNLDIGCSPERWLRRRDLNFSDAGHHWSEFEVPTGVVTDDGWLVFHRCQIVMAVPDEVHSYWHHQLPGDPLTYGSVWRISESEWLATFDPRHLKNCHHFVIDLEGDVVEVICEALLGGDGQFNLDQAIALHPRLADAHFWLGTQAERAGDFVRAESHFAKVAASDGAFFRNLAIEHISRLHAKR